jgi:hypothetical protein
LAFGPPLLVNQSFFVIKSIIMMFNRFPIVLCLGLTALLLVSPLVDANLFRPNSRSRQYPKKENIDLSANSQASVPSAQQITPETCQSNSVGSGNSACPKSTEHRACGLKGEKVVFEQVTIIIRSKSSHGGAAEAIGFIEQTQALLKDQLGCSDQSELIQTVIQIAKELRESHQSSGGPVRNNQRKDSNFMQDLSFFGQRHHLKSACIGRLVASKEMTPLIAADANSPDFMIKSMLTNSLIAYMCR